MFHPKSKLKLVIYLTVGLTLNFKSSNCENLFGSASPVTEKELVALRKFKEIAKTVVQHDYQREDSYLLNWVRASELNLDHAKRRLEKSMSWRKENSIDTLVNNPEMKKMEKKYPFLLNTVDKHGHPVLEFNSGRWDIRKVALAGKSEIFTLYWVYMFESAATKTRNLTASTGKQISEFVVIVDVGGFSLRSQGCLACLPILGRITSDYENNYAGFVHSFILPNAPRAFDYVFDFLKPLMSPATRNSVNLLSSDPEEIKQVFGKIINDDQLRRHYGGKHSR